MTRATLLPPPRNIGSACKVLANLSVVVAAVALIFLMATEHVFAFAILALAISCTLAFLVGRLLAYMAATLDDIGAAVGAPRDVEPMESHVQKRGAGGPTGER